MCIRDSVKAVEHFSATGELDVNANIQFGEGGAGTFSDGKLTTRIGDELRGFVTEVFLQHGAPEEIAWKQKPHVGTDLLRGVITSIQMCIRDRYQGAHLRCSDACACTELCYPLLPVQCWYHGHGFSQPGQVQRLHEMCIRDSLC